MRKILFSLLLATTVATPALARPGMGDRGDHASSSQEHKSDRSDSHRDRSQAREQSSQPREQRPQVREQRSQVREARPQMQQERMEIRQRMESRQAPVQRSDNAVREVVRERAVRGNRPTMPAANVNERGRPVLQQRRETNWGERTVTPRQVEQRQRTREGANAWRAERDVRQQQIEQRAERNRVRAPVGARPDRPAPVPQTAYRDNHHSKWRTDWRRDHRYDWRNYRNQHRSIFRLGAYFDPFGWNYRRYNIGWRLWPNYYSSNYWLNDPYMYRLPYAPFPYRWVRYYDDALLVNTYTGQVVDVMYDFFW
jgi:hypothetical protein